VSAAEVRLLVDRAQLVARGDAPASVLAAARAHRHAAHLLHTATPAGRCDAETASVLAAVNLANAVRIWK
jgi:hypothetical protein